MTWSPVTCGRWARGFRLMNMKPPADWVKLVAVWTAGSCMTMACRRWNLAAVRAKEEA